MVRIDKFLKLSRLVKRRTIAAKLCDAGAVRINSRQVKPSSDTACGDTIEIAFPYRLVTAKVLVDDEALLRRPHCEAVEILSEEPLNPEQNPWSEED